MTRSSIERIVVQRLAHQLVTQRFVERVYNQPLIGNVERGPYVECLIELALSELRPPWSLTDTWAAWDLEQRAERGARIEIKQSAALQNWDTSKSEVAPKFIIEPPRPADLYVMAWHDETDPNIADHRLPEQWRFYVVPEHRLPPGQKSITLRPLSRLAEACGFDDLAETVERAMPDAHDLKAARGDARED